MKKLKKTFKETNNIIIKKKVSTYAPLNKITEVEFSFFAVKKKKKEEEEDEEEGRKEGYQHPTRNL